MAAHAALLVAALTQAATGLVLLKPLNGTASSAHATGAALVQDQQRANSSGSRLDGLRAKRIAGLKDVASDLVNDEAQDNSHLKEIEKQIVSLVHQRNQIKRDKARKAREVSFIHAEISLIRRKSQMAKVEQAAGEDAQTNATDQSQNLASESVTAGDASAAEDAATAAEGAGADSSSSDGVQDLASADAELASASQAGAEGEAAASEGDSASNAALSEADMEAQAETRMRAEAEAKARAKVALEEAARQKAEAEQRAAAEAQRKAEEAAEAKQKAEEEEKERKKNELADHADDSFKDFMKQEDGEDQQGDTDYEDSANALAGAIGWNRQDIESNANKAVKSLTEAIGGKKVIQSLQGMMAGVSR